MHDRGEAMRNTKKHALTSTSAPFNSQEMKDRCQELANVEIRNKNVAINEGG
jgi:hypothetical protein